MLFLFNVSAVVILDGNPLLLLECTTQVHANDYYKSHTLSLIVDFFV